MKLTSTNTLTHHERNMRRVGAGVTVLVALVLIGVLLSPSDLAVYGQALGSISGANMLIATLYGFFALWCIAHLDVLGDRVFAGRVGRVSSLRLGLASRAFGHCGCWSKSFRLRCWQQMKLDHKPGRLKAIVRISNSAYFFGIVFTCLIVNIAYPSFLADFTGLPVAYIRLVFTLLIGGSALLAWQTGNGLWRERFYALMLVGLCQICVAFSIYRLAGGALDADFGAVLSVVVLANGIGWCMRVPFTFGVMELMMLMLAAPGQAGAVLAAVTVFHICFQGPALLIALFVTYAPHISVPLLFGRGQVEDWYEFGQRARQ